jgi:stage II sporulation protein AA (anti-sigma F factor antagonist)
MTGLSYISSAGLRVLLVVAKKVQQQHGKVALFGLSANVREVFTISGFDTIFSITADSGAALAVVR